MKKSFLLIITALCFTISAKSQASVLDIPLKWINGRPAFDLFINGKGPYTFIFDTGKMGGEISTDKSIADLFNLKIVDSLHVGDPSGNNNMVIPIAEMPEVTVGTKKFNGVRASISPRAMPGISGIIGLEFFKGYLVTLNLGSNKLELSTGELHDSKDGSVLSYKSMNGIPDVKITIGGHPEEAHFDSGNSRAEIIVPQSVADQLKFISAPQSAGIARSQFNQVEIKQGAVSGELIVGSCKFKNPVVSYPAFGGFVNLGAKFLKQFVITFDQKNQLLKMVKAS